MNRCDNAPTKISVVRALIAERPELMNNPKRIREITGFTKNAVHDMLFKMRRPDYFRKWKRDERKYGAQERKERIKQDMRSIKRQPKTYRNLCLKCDHHFMASSPYIRICPPCTIGNALLSPDLQVTAW